MADDARRHIGSGETHLRNGDLQLAADCFELALRFEERSMVALCGLARVQLRSGQVEEARRTVARALLVSEAHPDAMRLQAEVHARTGQLDLAIHKLHLAAEEHLDRQRYGARD